VKSVVPWLIVALTWGGCRLNKKFLCIVEMSWSPEELLIHPGAWSKGCERRRCIPGVPMHPQTDLILSLNDDVSIVYWPSVPTTVTSVHAVWGGPITVTRMVDGQLADEILRAPAPWYSLRPAGENHLIVSVVGVDGEMYPVSRDF